MRVSSLVGSRKKETPVDCQTTNHIYAVRGGYIRNVAAGIFSLYNPMRRVVLKIENILREEMDRIGGQEVLLPVVMPASLWMESGRYDAIGSEMLRFTDRTGAKNVLGMTHEEAAVHLVRDTVPSYQNYPFMIYQIQTKFRDEPRSRGGLVRVREFTMKDGYSFHTSWEDLNDYYQMCLEAYSRIYKRVGLAKVAAVKGDSGMMGGSLSHEFMFLPEIGEDKIMQCPHCDFIANLEATEMVVEKAIGEETEITKIHTPNIKTIQELCDNLQTPEQSLMKAVVYKLESDDSLVVAFIRGDLDVNETKLRNHLKSGILPVEHIGAESGLVMGFVGAIGLDKGLKCVFDRSLEGGAGLIGGANETDYHICGISMTRDLPNAEFIDIAQAVHGGTCPQCKQKGLTATNGVEIGNIFQLGDKYTKSMGMQYLDSNGELQHPTMGCYGIGVGRLAACICEAHHDEYGPIWPISVAPWQVELCALNINAEGVRKTAETIYTAFTEAGIETLYDDREVSAGVMFSDADLFGCPLRIVISPKTLARGCVELISRDKTLKIDLQTEDTGVLTEEIKGRIEALIKI